MPHSLAHWWVDSFVLSLRAGHRANAPVNPLLDGPVTGSWLSGPDCRASGSWPAGPPARLVTGSRLGDGNALCRGTLTTPDPYEWTSKWTDPVGVGPEHDTRPSRVYIRDRSLEYLLGAPGVGTLLATCTPLACARVDAAVRVMPLPETCAPAACAKVSGTATVIVAPTPPLSPPVVEATTAVSWFAPLSMVMVWPAAKPAPLATGITVAPTLVAAPTVVAPAVPTVAMTAVWRFAPVSIIIVWPAPKSATLATLILFAPAAEAADRVLAGCNRKSLQLLSVSRPSGKRPALLWGVLAAGAPAPPKPPRPAPGVGTRQPLSPAPEAAW